MGLESLVHETMHG